MLAWLNATPKPPEGSRREKSKAAQVSRFEAMKRQKIEPVLPPNPAPHIVGRLVEIGLTEVAGMGVAPISWQSINAWQQATTIRLAPWEARLLRSMSIAYVAEGRRAESETCPPPWRAPVTAQERDTERARLEMVLG